jgi:hypothetical protein
MNWEKKINSDLGFSQKKKDDDSTVASSGAALS